MKQIRKSPSNLPNSKSAPSLNILWLLQGDTSKVIAIWKPAAFLAVIKIYNSQDKRKVIWVMLMVADQFGSKEPPPLDSAEHHKLWLCTGCSHCINQACLKQPCCFSNDVFQKADKLNLTQPFNLKLLKRADILKWFTSSMAVSCFARSGSLSQQQRNQNWKKYCLQLITFKWSWRCPFFLNDFFQLKKHT